MWDLPRPGIEPVFPVLADRFLTTGPPGKSPSICCVSFPSPAWRIPWTEEPGGLQSTGSHRVRHGWAANTAVCQALVWALGIRWRTDGLGPRLTEPTPPTLGSSLCVSPRSISVGRRASHWDLWAPPRQDPPRRRSRGAGQWGVHAILLPGPWLHSPDPPRRAVVAHRTSHTASLIVSRASTMGRNDSGWHGDLESPVFQWEWDVLPTDHRNRQSCWVCFVNCTLRARLPRREPSDPLAGPSQVAKCSSKRLVLKSLGPGFESQAGHKCAAVWGWGLSAWQMSVGIPEGLLCDVHGVHSRKHSLELGTKPNFLLPSLPLGRTPRDGTSFRTHHLVYPRASLVTLIPSSWWRDASSISHHVLSTYYVPGTVLGVRGIALTRTTFCTHRAYTADAIDTCQTVRQ